LAPPDATAHAAQRPAHPRVYTIPAHRPFADAFAAGLLARHGGETLGLARGVVLVPNNRAARAITEAFVRRSAGGLLLPRLVPIGDADIEERVGGLLDPADEEEAIPPAIEPLDRLFQLAALVERHLPGVEGAEALRLAENLAQTLDQLLVEEIAPSRLRGFAADLPDLSLHWQASLERLAVIMDHWPRRLAERGRIDLAERRRRLLGRLAARWSAAPPAGFVAAAGITTAAPAVARLLRVVSRLPEGLVVLPGLDTGLAESEWAALGPHEPDPATGQRRRSIETHPQFHLKLLLERMGVGRAEVRRWRWSGGPAAPASRGRAVANAMLPAASTAAWATLSPADRRLPGVRAIEAADPAEEAQAVAVALREALETPARTAALVTPDRALARRVAAHLRRWGVAADDSAGRPLSELAPGTLLLALAGAAAEQFAPVPLLALLKHPLVAKGEGRLAWLEGARLLDLALRGPRPPAGLDGISALLADRSGRRGERELRGRAEAWWRGVAPRLKPLERAFRDGRSGFARLLEALRVPASDLTGDEVWAGPAGREAADLLLEAEAAAAAAGRVAPRAFAAMLEQLLRSRDVRPPYGQHPRLFIWGQIEARLQRADLVILAGLNEGVWPQLPAPDPWLAPRLRHELGLPGLERRIGVSAHDFASGLGAPAVLVTRARRDARAPAIPSRFWLRLEAMTGGLTRSPVHIGWARAVDRPAALRPAERPAPRPPLEARPRRISVTEVDRLKADPFAFYARKLLALPSLDPVDADPTAAWRGSAVHRTLEAWMKEDDCEPSRLRGRAEALLREASAHPLMRALWQPRLLEAIDWIAAEVARNAEAGRRPLAAEAKGACELAGVSLYGEADRIDRLPGGGLAIVDYKTGMPPGPKAVAEGYSMQLGLLGLIAERGGFEGIEGLPELFEYWSLAKKAGKLGHVASPVGGRSGLDATDFTARAARNFIAAAEAWLTGDAPFTAKLHPEHAPYGEYDQLMRLDEWYGREG